MKRNLPWQFLTIPAGAGTLMPDDTRFADYANCHNYLTHPGWPGLHDNQTWGAADPSSACRVDGLCGNIGTDIDDVFALALVLASPKLGLRGVTTVSDDAYGRALIACRFLEAAGRSDVPVAAGRPRRGTPAATGQYEYGLNAGRKHPEPELAVEFLYQQLKARPGELTIITIGDLTNVGELITRHPEAEPWIRGVVRVATR